MKLGANGELMNFSGNIIHLNDYKKFQPSFKSNDLKEPIIKEDPLNRGSIEISNIDSIGWAFDGGGAKGIFQIGVSCALAKAGMIPDVIVGTSVGSINTAACAMGRLDNASEVWKDINKEKVYTSKLSQLLLNGYKRLLHKAGMAQKPKPMSSILDNNPLGKFLKKHIDKNQLVGPDAKNNVEFMFGLTDVNSGKEALFSTPKLFNRLKSKYLADRSNTLTELTPENFNKALLASTSIPVAFPPVEINNRLYMDGAGTFNPAKNGVNALFALNKDLKEGLLFIVLLEPMNKAKEKQITKENADITALGMRTISIGLENIAQMDIEATRNINKEIKLWDVINLTIKDNMAKATHLADSLKYESEKLLRSLNVIEETSYTKQLKRLAEKLSSLSKENFENTNELQTIIKEYKPFKNKRKVKLVVIRPEHSLDIEKMDFHKVQSRSEELIKAGYEATLGTLYKTKLITIEKYYELMQQIPCPEGNIFKNGSKKLYKVI